MLERADVRTSCPLCGDLLSYHGGWAYVRSKALLHLESCRGRKNESAADCAALADKIADRIGGDNVEDRDREAGST